MTDAIRYIAQATPRRSEVIYGAYADAMEQLQRPNIALFKTHMDGLPYHISRNELVRQCLTFRANMRKANPPAEIEGIFWVDDDVIVPPDALVKLLSHGQDIVSGLYISRRMPHTPQMYVASPEYGAGKYWPVLDWEQGALIEADTVGFGCVYTSFRVIDAIAAAQTEGLHGRLWRTKRRLLGRPFDQPEWFFFDWPQGEDFWFCRLAKREGFPIYVDTSIVCEHLAVLPITLETFRVLRPRLYRIGPDGKPVSGSGDVAVEAK